MANSYIVYKFSRVLFEKEIYKTIPEEYKVYYKSFVNELLKSEVVKTEIEYISLELLNVIMYKKGLKEKATHLRNTKNKTIEILSNELYIDQLIRELDEIQEILGSMLKSNGYIYRHQWEGHFMNSYELNSNWDKVNFDLDNCQIYITEYNVEKTKEIEPMLHEVNDFDISRKLPDSLAMLKFLGFFELDLVKQLEKRKSLESLIAFIFNKPLDKDQRGIRGQLNRLLNENSQESGSYNADVKEKTAKAFYQTLY